MSMIAKTFLRRAVSVLTVGSIVGLYAMSALVLALPAYAASGSAPSSVASGVVEVSTASCRGASTAMTPDLCEGANEAANQVDDKLVSPAMQVALLSALMNLVTFVFDRIAYEAAIWVATGGEGETPLFHTETAADAWKDFGLDIAGDAIGELNSTVLDQLNIDFDICAPEDSLFKLAIQLGIKQAYQPQQPKCDFQDVMKNWDSFVTTTVLQAANPSQTVLKAFAEGFKPGQNELSATVGLNLKVHQRVLEAKTANLLDQTNNDFFDVTDLVTGTVKTPSSILEAEFKRQIGDSQSVPTQLQAEAAIQNADLLSNMFLHVAGTFTNTLLSQLMNKIYTGLFDVAPLADPFDVELAGISSREDAANRFSSLITVAPTQVENYNVLAEFVACPIGPVAVRNLNNCVMDSSFVSAVSRAESGVPMTVQEAIDEGLIHGDWPLIPHEGDGIPKNQDPLCYTYGYCYGNLVKMRKARVIPVGWEIAAAKNDSSNPATLQEIIDGYDDCGTQGGGIDSNNEWCHLIDPDWVLKYPETQCRALVNGELQISTLSPGRAGACVDTPSCISESNDGSCDGGFGYCTEEKNVWRFRGDECPEQYASCLSFSNTFTNDRASYLFNTLDQAGCNADNAGCEWYRTNKYYDDGGTADDDSDDSYVWLPESESFVTADREDDVKRYDPSTTSHVAAASYDSDGDGTNDYSTYAYQDRIYFNNNVEECSSDAAGCSAVYPINGSLVLNAVQNPSFEDDEDLDDQPDSWSTAYAAGTLDKSQAYSYYGDNAYTTGSVGVIYQPNIQIGSGNFYTFSFHARQASTGGTDAVAGRVVLKDADGAYLDLAGTSVAGDCAVADWLTGTDNSVLIENMTPEGEEFERYECVFTVPDEGNGAIAEVWLYSRGAYVDAVQLELGEDASSFVDGYNASTPSTSYLLVPPDYLGCDGDAADPAECGSYAQVCQAQDVGCNLYTPDNGDPSVPAIASALDECPSECVGYTTYKQEATDREEESFPLYFIADRANSCSSQYVGCDAFTNLDATSAGGEGSESYTYLRACVKPEMATGSADNDVSSTYFTWEGSDAAGYQLVTWTLLQSDDTDAPCSAWDVQGEDTLVCDEDASVDYETDACDSHDDIFDNPDCREFYGTDGSIYYRDVTLTVAVDSDCHPYRMDGSNETDCEASGGYWTDTGDCRYFGLADESTECPASQAGCREYTGGAGRNATTVYSDDFEDGSLSEYDENTGATATVSNESLAVDGHSMRLSFSSDSSVVTAMRFLSSSDTSLSYDETDATCSDLGTTRSAVSGGCEIDDGTGNACTVESGDNNCGTLDDLLVQGKTYVLSFWAKGSDDLYVKMIDLGGSGDAHDFVDPTTPTTYDALALEGAWHQYVLGPLDTSDFSGFDDSAVISFGSVSGSVVYVDNVRLKAVEENVTIIKDSWVVPSTCDETPDGAESDQYYLGCEAYTDQDGDAANLYQFSDLCSEDVVGCEAVYDTQNSDSAFGTVYNARCEYVSNDTTDDDTVSASTACALEGETACTIAAGKSFCLFDREGAMPSTLPYSATTDGYFYMTLGPEAVVVDSDVPMYLVDDGTASCTAANAGCEEIGVPTYNQDKTEVDSFESAYYINDPDSYDDVLCGNDELFCEEWSSTQDGNFYFKDPVDQTCEYQTGVTIDGTSYYGWFKTDTDEPCYDDYVVGGSELGIWRNGDEEFSGWAGTCSSSYDLCTEFRDIADTSGTTYPAGTPYYFKDDSSLDEESLTASQQCNGQVSQKEGCGLFYDTNDSELTYNTTASYVASTHADVLYGDAPGSKQDPISCDDGGEDITTPDGEVVNLCETRCYYDTADDDEIATPSATEILTRRGSLYDDVGYLERSCYEDSDCPTLETVGGEEVDGTCVEPDADLSVPPRLIGSEDPYLLSNDSNRVLRVYRDRECAAWLSCQSAQVSWNERTSRYETICDRVGLCTRYTRTGDTSFCTEWADVDPVLLDAGEYAGRDTTWNGIEYSGYAIPEQLPVSEYDQVNIAPDANDSICVHFAYDAGGVPVPELDSEGNFISCVGTTDEEDDCSALSVCRNVPQDYRLGYVAGDCDLADVGWLGECVVGHCEESGNGCASDGDCSGSEQCVVGYCQYVDSAVSACTNDSQCTTAGYGTCDTTLAKCVNDLAPNSSTCVEDADCSSASGGVCTPDALTKKGSCVNNQCATDIFGEPLSASDAEEKECRGYPETTSPFPTEIVEEWRDSEDTASTSSSPEDYDWQPYSFTYGFETQTTCSPTINDAGSVVLTDDCVCSYDKAQYGTSGAIVRYYPPGTDLSTLVTDDDNYDGFGDSGSANTGICMGGEFAGAFCEQDSDCQKDSTSYSGGTCAKFDRKDTVYGWDGYCLERDTSIQKNGSSDSSDGACLTWLPVDQLSGATDLYGKYKGAGYNEGDTYYCAEVEVGYRIKAGESFYALPASGSCDDRPLSRCPEGTFMAFQDCEERSLTVWDEDEYKDDDYESWKARCVPYNSYVDGDYEMECTHADDDTNWISTTNHDWETWSNIGSCQTPLLTSPSQVNDWMDLAENFSIKNGIAYNKGDLSPDAVLVEAVPYCKTVVKVSDSSAYNYAWTDRVSSGDQTDYTLVGIGSAADSYFEFNTDTEIAVFGKADDVTESAPIDTTPGNESSPIKTLMCELSDYSFVLPFVDGSCDSGSTVDDWQARSFLDFEAYPAGTIYASDTELCDEDASLLENGCNDGVECASDGTCSGGVRDGRTCEVDEDCALLVCVHTSHTYDSGGIDYTDFTDYCATEIPYVTESETTDDVVARLGQIFAKSISLTSGAPWWEYSFGNDWTNEASYDDIDDWGAYEQTSEVASWDVTATGDDYSGATPTVPVIRSVGDCDGTQCQEGSINHFSVNGVDNGDITGSDGYKHVAVSFFTYADANQMPIRNIMVDWGSDDDALGVGMPWDTGDQSGSTADDNFYQNHRGYDSNGEPICSSSDGDADDWSYSPDACDTSYVTFVHDYTCTEGMLDELPSCEVTTDPNGLTRLVYSPCSGGEVPDASGACVFQPRVHVEDNWGWCTGWCDSADSSSSPYWDGTESATDGQCYSGECNVDACPSEGESTSCPDYYGGIDNPWINFDGYVIVTP